MFFAVKEHLLQSHDPKRETMVLLELFVLIVSDFRAAAADIDRDAARELGRMQNGIIPIKGFFFFRQQQHFDAGFLAYLRNDIIAVDGLADSGCRYRHQNADLILIGDGFETFQDFDEYINPCLGHLFLFVQILKQASRGLYILNLKHRKVFIDFKDDQTNRVGSDID
ncbi:hypothetical protein SDC9_93153 [bioreactor metagenome]|uniref:Uncharacterized protein n=1 Tax=bioreactor metagenome TaxID=1076179 RepID=A0A645A6F8_9ZZZZ